MIRRVRIGACMMAFGLAVMFAIPACQSGSHNHAKTTKTTKTDHDHAHGEEGPNGGPLAEWGEYHAEFTADHDAKQAIVFILDDGPNKAPDVDPKRFTKVRLTITSAKPPISLDLTHDAKKSGPKGIAFVGTHDELGKKTGFKGNLSAIRDENGKDSKKFSAAFEYKGPKEKGKTANLAVTPGGIYTAADVKANGNTTPALKYGNRNWEHSDDLKPGDKICPVTNNKAEADCFWIIQGQRYEFCCHPCVDKLIRYAHNEPAKVKNAADYVYQGK